MKTLDDGSSFDVPKRRIVNCSMTFGTVYYLHKWDKRVESVKTLDGGSIFDVPKLYTDVMVKPAQLIHHVVVRVEEDDKEML